jgi:hypothetical protein
MDLADPQRSKQDGLESKGVSEGPASVMATKTQCWHESAPTR